MFTMKSVGNNRETSLYDLEDIRKFLKRWRKDCDLEKDFLELLERSRLLYPVISYVRNEWVEGFPTDSFEINISE